MKNKPLGLAALLLLLLATAACSGRLGNVSRVVVVTLDTTRADRIGCYGYDKAATANLDRLAEEGVLFEQAVAQAATTLPSHCTIFTGLYPQDHGVRYNLVFNLAPEAVTLAEILKENGFATAAFPATYILHQRHGLNQGFDTYIDPPRVPRDAVGHPDDIMRPAGDGVDLALEWLDEHGGEKLFIWLHLYDPHAPYAPPFPHSARFRDRPYDGEIAYADAQLGRFLERLRKDPQWDETLVVVAGDHGEGLHDHGERFHSYLLYETTQRVPLIIRAPGAGPARVAEPVVLADIMPTILDMTGIEPPAALRGISLGPALAGGELPRRDLYFESLSGALNYGWAELKGIRYGSWKLIDSLSPELFDLAEDPEEMSNVAAMEPDRLDELRTALEELGAPLEGAEIDAEVQDAVMDRETEAFLASLGYVGASAGGSSGESAPHPRELVDLASEMLAAQAAIASRSWAYVEELCRYVLSRDPTNKWAHKNIIEALIETGRAEEAQDYGAEFVRIYPDNPPSYAMLARAYQAQGLSAKAYDVLKQGLKANPDSEMLEYLSLVAAFDAERPEVCSQEVHASLARYPDSWRMLLLKARCEARGEEHEAALETLRAAADRGFKSFDVLEQAEEFAEVMKLPGFAELAAEAEPKQQAGEVVESGG
jgi:arylsulfatase A-like enzyme